MIELPLLSPLARRRGWPYLMAWLHRLTGLFLAAFVLFHIKTLSLIAQPGAYETRMALFAGPVFVFLEWALAVPVMLHAVNGGRLILFESFSFRNDHVLLKNVFIVAGLYALVLAILMQLGEQVMTPLAFWLPALVVALAVSWGLTRRMLACGLPPTFTLQRVTGAFLLIMIPAHLFFMHLSPEVARSSAVVADRLRLGLVQVVDTTLVAAILYHAGHGLIAMVSDYLTRGPLRILLSVVIIFLLGFFGLMGLQLIWRL